MIKYVIFFYISTMCVLGTKAQSQAGLVRYFSFDNCDGRDEGSTGVDAIVQNGPVCGCGVIGTGLEFDGLDDAIIIPGTENIFNTNDFSISLYYKSTFGGSQDLISRKEQCDETNAFSIRVIPGSNTIITQMRENNSKGTLWNTPLDQSNCWHHVVFIRKAEFHTLYLDGVLVEEQSTVSRTDISNENIQLQISGGPCLGIQDLPFQGSIDELRIYNRALNDFEIEELMSPIDQILTQDTLIFLGNSIDIETSQTCGNSFAWSPADGVSDIGNQDATITPNQTTVYQLSIGQDGCNSSDSIRISVIDPDLLDCEQLFMANAFTPNGDGNNDTYGISNPFALENFVSIEILNRWGDRVYFSTDKFVKWDGRFKGSEADAGVYLYRVFYRCGDEEQFRTGSVTLIR